VKKYPARLLCPKLENATKPELLAGICNNFLHVECRCTDFPAGAKDGNGPAYFE
jgi:hypothetical protein